VHELKPLSETPPNPNFQLSSGVQSLLTPKEPKVELLHTTMVLWVLGYLADWLSICRQYMTRKIVQNGKLVINRCITKCILKFEKHFCYNKSKSH